MFQESHRALHVSMRDYNWFFLDHNGDTGWIISRHQEESVIRDSSLARIVGTDPAFQILVDGETTPGLYVNLDKAKMAAESYILKNGG